MINSSHQQMLLLCLLTCLVTLTAAVAASAPLATPPSNIVIAWIQPISAPLGSAVNTGIPSLFGAHLAVDKINTEGQLWRNNVNAAIQAGMNQSQAIAQAGTAPLLPWTNLSISICDSQSDLSLTTGCAFNAITKNNAHILVGDASSSPTMQMGYVANLYGTPVLSPSAAAVEFSNRATFKNFLRIVVDIGEEERQLAAFIGKNMQWRKVGIASDSFGIGGANNFAAAAKLARNNVQILTTVTYNLGDTDFSFQLQRLITSKARIIVHVGIQDDLWRLWRYASSAYANGTIDVDLFSTGYQWIICHSPALPSFYTNTNGGPIEDIIPLVPGTIGIQFPWTSPAFQQTAEFNELADRWDHATQYIPQGYPAMSVVNPSTTEVGRTFRTSLFVKGGVLGWDAVYLIARGAAFAMEQGVDPTSTNITEKGKWYNALVQQPPWKASSGNMKLNSVGDRDLGFAILNWKRGSKGWESMGYMTSGTITHIDPTTNKTVTELDYTFSPNPDSGLTVEEALAAFEYTGAAPGTEKPSDTPPRELVNLSDATKNGLITATIVIVIVLFLVEIGIVVWRDHVTLKAASPLFLFLFVFGIQLLCLSLIGRAYESDPDSSPHQCLADHWLTNLGYALLSGALLVKTIRLQTIFNARILRSEKRFLSDAVLLLCLGVLMLLEIIMLLALQYSTDIGLVRQELNDEQDYYSCRSTERDDAGQLTKDKLASVYLPTIITCRFILLVTTAIYAFLARNIPDLFNESRQLLVCIYNLLFLSILLPAIDGAMGRGKETSAIAYGVCVCVICILSIGIMLAPKFYDVTATMLGWSTALKGAHSSSNMKHSGEQSSGQMTTGSNGQGGGGRGKALTAVTKGSSGGGVQMSPAVSPRSNTHWQQQHQSPIGGSFRTHQTRMPSRQPSSRFTLNAGGGESNLSLTPPPPPPMRAAMTPEPMQLNSADVSRVPSPSPLQEQDERIDVQLEDISHVPSRSSSPPPPAPAVQPQQQDPQPNLRLSSSSSPQAGQLASPSLNPQDGQTSSAGEDVAVTIPDVCESN